MAIQPQQNQAVTLQPTGFIRQSALLPILGFSSSSLWRYVKNGTFPAPVKLSANITAWRCEDVRAWIEAKSDNQSAA